MLLFWWVLHFPWELCGRYGVVSLVDWFGYGPKIGGGKPVGKGGYISNYANNLAARLRDVNAS